MIPITVSALEVAIGQVLTQHYVLHPNALDSEKKEFSLADLAAFATPKDARDAAIALRVEAMMRGSMDDWSRDLEKLRLPTPRDVVEEYDDLTELIQRRHVIVHNQSRVSPQYLRNVGTSDLTVGEQLDVTRRYLEHAVDLIEVAGTCIVAAAWAQWLPKDVEWVATRINDRAADLLKQKRWQAACALARYGKTFKGASSTLEYLKVNEWIARKRIGGLDSVKSEVDAWDVSMFAPLYQLAKHSLLDDMDAAFALLSKCSRTDLVAVREWPVFEEVRRDPRYKDDLVLIELRPPDVSEVQATSGPEENPDHLSSPASEGVDADDN